MAKQRQRNNAPRNHQISEEDSTAAASWWNSLPGGKKRYLKEHSRLSSEEKIQRYWLAHVKAPTPLADQERNQQKVFHHALNYGIGAEEIAAHHAFMQRSHRGTH